MGTTVALIGSSGALATARTPDSNASNNDPRPGVGDGLASVGASSLWGAQEVSKSGVAITRPRGGSRDCRVGVSPWCGSRFTAARGTSPPSALSCTASALRGAGPSWGPVDAHAARPPTSGRHRAEAELQRRVATLYQSDLGTHHPRVPQPAGGLRRRGAATASRHLGTQGLRLYTVVAARPATEEGATVPSTRQRASVVRVGPVARYSPTDSPAGFVRPLTAYTPKLLAEAAALDRATARTMITAARKRSFEGAAFLRATLDAATAQRVLRVALLPCDSRVVVNDVVPLDGWVMSDQPFVLRVSFAVAEPTTGLARVVAEWAGLRTRLCRRAVREGADAPDRARVVPRHVDNEPRRTGRFQDHVRGAAVQPVLPRTLAVRPFRDWVVQLAVGA